MTAAPHELPARGSARGARRPSWWRRLGAIVEAIGRDHLSIMAAGTAYYAFLSIFPAMTALVLTYGLVADPTGIERDVGGLAAILPGEAMKLLADQLHALVAAPPAKLGIGLIVSVLFAVWTAMGATGAVMQALTVAYDGVEHRSVLQFYAISLLLTLGFFVFGLLTVALIAGVPAAVAEVPMPEVWREALPLVQWPILVVLTPLALGTLYRVAPDREQPRWDFLRAGTLAASLLWLAASVGFSFYVSDFGSYDRTYGSLGAIVVLLVWFWVSAFIVFAGAELNRAVTRRDDSPPP